MVDEVSIEYGNGLGLKNIKIHCLSISFHYHLSSIYYSPCNIQPGYHSNRIRRKQNTGSSNPYLYPTMCGLM